MSFTTTAFNIQVLNFVTFTKHTAWITISSVTGLFHTGCVMRVYVFYSRMSVVMANETEIWTETWCFIKLLGQLIGVWQMCEGGLTLPLLLYLTQGHMCPSACVNSAEKESSGARAGHAGSPLFFSPCMEGCQEYGAGREAANWLSSVWEMCPMPQQAGWKQVKASFSRGS